METPAEEDEVTPQEEACWSLYACHMHALEEEHERTLYCGYEEKTGDKKYPVLCLKDNRYATAHYCKVCKKRREHHV